jgi:hypothetical protein
MVEGRKAKRTNNDHEVPYHSQKWILNSASKNHGKSQLSSRTEVLAEFGILALSPGRIHSRSMIHNHCCPKKEDYSG